MTEYKFSRYNFKIEKEGMYLLYNSRTGGYLMIDDDNTKYLKECSLSDVDNYMISSFPDSMKEYLIKGGFIIPKGIDELKMLEAFHKLASEGSAFSLTIVPTLGCDFRCSYCFERWNDYPEGMMSIEVQDAIVEYLDKNIPSGGSLSVCWYGGEPLLGFDVIKRLQGKINDLAEKKKIGVYPSIITNGYNFDKETSKTLADLGLKVAQITLDGSEKHHNNFRHLKNGDGSFKKIIDNILCADDRIMISIRVNVNMENVNHLDEFHEEMKKYGLANKKNVEFYYSIIRDSFKKDYVNKEDLFNVKSYSKLEVDLVRRSINNGIRINPNINPKIHSCGAVSTKSLLIEPSGDIQKCYEYVGDKSKCIGNILSDFKELDKDRILENTINWYSWSPFKKEDCKGCKILPLCFGGCPMYSLEEENFDINYKCSNLKYNIKNMLELVFEESVKSIS